ncbi:MAG: serine hydrolase, partial [Bacteroidia bacterium]|nr:serine hydrolase [Bacteroidia bacterium]
MSRYLLLISILAWLPSYSQKTKKVNTPTIYYPDKEWVHKTPAEVGINEQRLKEAIGYAIANEPKNPRSMEQNHYQSFGREPFGDAIGPMKDRGAPTGIIIKNGYIIAEWGDPSRVDMTHSVTKSFLSTVVGLAYDQGLIKNIHDTVRNYVPPIQVYSPYAIENKAEHFGKEQMLSLFETTH